MSRLHVTYIGVEPACYCITVAVGRAFGVVGPVPRDGHVVRRGGIFLRRGEGCETQRDKLEDRRGTHVVSLALKPCLQVAFSGEQSGNRVGLKMDQLSNRDPHSFCSEEAAGR